MKKIDTLEELRAERIRLRARKLELESDIRLVFAEIKSDLQPLNMIKNGAASLFSNRTEGDIVGNTAGMITNFLLRNVLLRNSGFITRLVLPFLARNATANYVSEHKTKITDWLLHLYEKIRKKPEEKHKEPHYPESDQTFI